jgi:hypothetical protein
MPNAFTDTPRRAVIRWINHAGPQRRLSDPISEQFNYRGYALAPDQETAADATVLDLCRHPSGGNDPLRSVTDRLRMERSDGIGIDRPFLILAPSEIDTAARRRMVDLGPSVFTSSPQSPAFAAAVATALADQIRFHRMAHSAGERLKTLASLGLRISGARRPASSLDGTIDRTPIVLVVGEPSPDMLAIMNAVQALGDVSVRAASTPSQAVMAMREAPLVVVASPSGRFDPALAFCQIIQ